MLPRTLIALCILSTFSQCEKAPRPPSSTGYLPVRIYVSTLPKDTVNAVVIDYNYNADGYLTSRQKHRANTLLETVSLRYNASRQISEVDYVTSNASGNFSYSYDPANLKATVVHTTSIPGTGNVYTYSYRTSTNSLNYTYPASQSGVLRLIVDSAFSGNAFASKTSIELGYGAPNTDRREVFTTTQLSLPNTPVISTINGQYMFVQKGVSTPFVNVFPDFLELPPFMWEPAAFNRAGFLSTYKILDPNSPSSETDTYQVAEMVGQTSMPRLIRKTMDGRRSGAITTEHFYIIYNK